MHKSVPLALGALTFALLQGAWSLGHAYAGWRGAWIMKTGTGMAACLVVFAVASALVIAWRHAPAELMRRAGHLWLGAMGSLAIALLIVGPGNIWPLVIVLDGAILAGGIAVGAVLGNVLGGRLAA